MRSLALSFTVLAGLAGAPVLAQTAVPVTPQGVPPAPTRRPARDPATRSAPACRMPMGTRASNIDASDTRSMIAPNLPSPPVGPNASAVDYLRAAQTSLQAGRTGEAQQSLEMAQTRLLDRSVPMGQTNNPSDNPAVTQMSQALEGTGAGDRAQTMQLIQSAIPATATRIGAVGRALACTAATVQSDADVLAWTVWRWPRRTRISLNGRSAFAQALSMPRPQVETSAHLLLVHGENAPPRHVPLNLLPLIVGRSAPAEVILEGSTVSRRHCRLERQGDSIVLTDLGSTNGTFVNSERVSAPVVLEDGARITIGAHALSYHRRSQQELAGWEALDRELGEAQRLRAVGAAAADHRRDRCRPSGSISRARGWAAMRSAIRCSIPAASPPTCWTSRATARDRRCSR